MSDSIPEPWAVRQQGRVWNVWIPEPCGKHENCSDGVLLEDLQPENARLIAAAPDLLEACKAAMVKVGYADQLLTGKRLREFEEFREIVSTALAKARGEA